MLLDFFSRHKFSINYEGRCGNCHALFDSDDAKFCVYCGTKRGKGKFLPYENVTSCVYGPPPMIRKHICENCGYSWNTKRMIDNSRYCPQCGNTIKTVTEDDEL